MVARTGIEPVTLGLWVPRSNQLSYGTIGILYHIFGTPGTIWTCGLQFRKLTLYPAELRVPRLITLLLYLICWEKAISLVPPRF